MGVFLNILAAIVGLSFVVFCALFGSLPRLRKTPVGFINRLIWHRVPALLLSLDSLLTGGRSIRLLKRIGNYLMNENHPIVMIFYLSLVVGAQVAFLPRALPELSAALTAPVPLVVLCPYVFTYLSWSSGRSYIAPSTVAHELSLYPYDRVLFRPGPPCRTCALPKPARSKHCRICKRCVAKMDHHCIWVANCLGRENYRWFLLMLLSLGTMLAYGAFLGWCVLGARIERRSVEAAAAAAGGAFPAGAASGHWSAGLSWRDYSERWAWAFTKDVWLGAAALLAAMTAPLAWGLLAYHVYLVWAGTTTNESFKWEDWVEDVRDGYVYRHTEPRAAAAAEGGGGEDASRVDAVISWPVRPEQRLVSRANAESLSAELEPGTVLGAEPWVVVESLADVVNIYDLGFWDNLRDVVYLR